MKKTRVLYVSQESVPFLPKNLISHTTRHLSQGIFEQGKEIRIFTPRYGCINERRHQLHEVIRLSGMNLIINDTDHPLIIKVASIPAVRMQVYFIDNEEFFHRKAVLKNENGDYFGDNDERSMFFCKGVLETVKKLGWAPDIIHCHGWFTALLPLYVKRYYNDDPHFAGSKVVYSAYDEGFPEKLDEKLSDKLVMDNFDKEDIEPVLSPDFVNLNKLAIQHSDGVIQGSEIIDDEILGFASDNDKEVLSYQSEEVYVQAYDEFYENILEESSVLVD